MSQQQENAFLFPDAFNDTSRFSTPRSSIGEGLSTDCEADVESNLSANSEDASPHRRRSSNGIYGIVKANKAVFTSRRTNQNQGNEKEQDGSFGWKMMSSTQKLAFVSAIVVCLLFILGFVFMFPSCRGDCRQKDESEAEKIKVGVNWPVEFENASPTTEMILGDVDFDGKKDIIFALSRFSAKEEKETGRNKSMIVAIDAEMDVVLKKIYIDFEAFWIHCDANDHLNASCLVVAQKGTIAKVNMAVEEVEWSFQPCSEIHSVSQIEDIDSDGILDLIVVCSWQSTENTMISGIALVSGIRGDLLGSKIRYQLSQLPSSFLMQHNDAKNNTCILFGTQRNNKSTIWAVRLKRLVEIATGARKKVNLVSENPLLVVKNARTNVRPVHYDISNDGVKDIGFALQEGLIAFIDGVTLKLRKTIDARGGHIESISILPVKNFGRPLLAVFKTSENTCEDSILSIYNFRNSFDPYTIKIPETPVLMAEIDPAKKKLFVMLLKDRPRICSKIGERLVKQGPKAVDEETAELPLVKKPKMEDTSLGDLSDEDEANDIDIEAIDKDVLDNLREYIGINDMGVTRYHKLFHLVCNYLLLRFLISYGITTESVLKDFRSTRSHLLNLSNRNLGHVLTNQLKGLLATDYNNDSDFVPLLDDLDNDVEWLRGVQVKEPIRRKRRDVGKEAWSANGDGSRAEKEGGNKWKNSLKKVLFDITEAAKDPSGVMNETEVGLSRLKQRLQNESLNWFEKNQRKSSVKSCQSSTPMFKILEINKANYIWKNATKETGRKTIKDNTEEEGCYKMNFEVKDMLVYKHRLYYISQFVTNEPNTNKVTQLTWLDLNY